MARFGAIESGMADHETLAPAAFQYTDSDGSRISVVRATAPENYAELIAQTMYEGVALPNVAHEFKNDPMHDVRFTQPYGERNAVGYLLVTAGYYKTNLHSEKPPIPDVRAELADGSIVYIETAEVIESPSARLEGVFHFVNVGIAKAVSEDPALDQKLNGHDVQVRAWMTDSGKYDRQAILREFLDFLRGASFDDLPEKEFTGFPESCVALKSIDAKFWYSKVMYRAVPRFQANAHSYAPESLASQVIPILEQKRSKRYEGSPVWLALYMSDMLGVPQDSLDVLERVPLDFSPFDKLLVGDQRSVLVYTRELANSPRQ